MTVQIINGDARTAMHGIPNASVQCVVTSPPYFGLRDYGTASWDGGDATCDHTPEHDLYRSAVAASTMVGTTDTQVEAQRARSRFGDECGKCGAHRIDAQIGLEPTVEAYVAELVAVFREVRRVLRDDGCLFLNLGDSYNAARDGGHAGGAKQASLSRHNGIERSGANVKGLKPKDLIGVPWRVAFALQADGWYLRSDIIWAKPNPMPESVRDRPTKAHEYIFLLTKSPRYFWDAEAIREESVEPERVREDRVGGKNGHTVRHSPGGIYKQDAVGKRTYTGFNARWDERPVVGRNIRSVWTIATAPFAEAHFATFPPALAERCIKAGSATGDTVLDPFGGAGTVSLVAERLGRDSIYVDLSPEYAAMAERRIRNECPMFTQIERV
jgi:DNA modification methylase